MTGLFDLERQFQAAILAKQPIVPAGVLGGAQESAETMFEIYRNAYWIRLVESLGVDFPGLKALLGAQEFARMARSYIERHPSNSRSIRWIGGEMANFLAAHGEYSLDPMIADMARLDWALAHAFDAGDASIATLSDLLATPPEAWGSLRLSFHPSVRAFKVSTPVLAARARLLSDPSARIDESDRRDRRDRGVMTWRVGGDLKYRETSTDELSAHACIEGGGTFGDMCELLAVEEPDGAAMMAASVLRGWIDWGAVAEISHDGRSSR